MRDYYILLGFLSFAVLCCLGMWGILQSDRNPIRWEGDDHETE